METSGPKKWRCCTIFEATNMVGMFPEMSARTNRPLIYGSYLRFKSPWNGRWYVNSTFSFSRLFLVFSRKNSWSRPVLIFRVARFQPWYKSLTKSWRCLVPSSQKHVAWSKHGIYIMISGQNMVYTYIYIYPIGSMYGIFIYIYPKNGPNVGKYSIHGASGYDIPWVVRFLCSCRLLQTPIYGEWPSLFAGSSKKNALSLGLWAPCQICEFL